LLVVLDDVGRAKVRRTRILLRVAASDALT
jgi:hypothetical protein